ncbi:MAG TPA: hypothetical protein VF067_03910 [Sphingomicrobium sp.]
MIFQVTHSGDLDRDGLEATINQDETVGAHLTALAIKGIKSLVSLDDSADAPPRQVKLVLPGEKTPKDATPICAGDVVLKGQKIRVSAVRMP